MLREVFAAVLRMSLTGSFVIAAVTLARFCLKKAPRTASYCLWIVVLFRLCCPVSFESGFSLLPRIPAAQSPAAGPVWTPPAAAQPLPPAQILPGPTSPADVSPVPTPAKRPDAMTALAMVWLGVGAAMLGGSAALSIRLHGKLKNAR